MVVAALCWIWAVLLAARVEHLIAGVVWLKARGLKCYGSKRFKKAATAEDRWKVYRKYDGGKLPWLFVGMRAHRLRAIEEQRGLSGKRTVAASVAWVGRVAWIYPVVGLVTPVLLVTATEITGPLTSAALLACSFVLVAGAIVIAVEGGVCAVLFGSWGDAHHRIGSDVKAMREVRAGAGSVLVALAATIALIWIAVRRYDSFPGVAGEGALVQRIADAIQVAIAFIAQNPPDQVQGAVGTYVVLALRILWIAYILALVTLVGWLVRTSSQRL